MPQTLDAQTLAALGAPIAAELLPGWRITWVACSQEQLDQLIPGALAVCRPLEDTTPTREMATVYVLSTWPDSESLAETLWHELTHARLADLVSMVPSKDTAAAVLIEEKIVERLGVLLARIPLAARLAVARALAAPRVALSQPVRARLSALAPRARGGSMDPKIITEALDALIAGDAEKCAELLKGLIASAAGAPAPDPAGDVEPPTDPAGKAPAPSPSAAPAPAGNEPPPMDDAARKAARKGAPIVDPEIMRARKAAQDDAAELKLITTDARKGALDGLVLTLRARLPGHSGLPGIEKRVLAAPTYERAKEIADTAIEMGGGQARARARDDKGNLVEHEVTPPAAGTTGACPYDPKALVAEGFSEALAAEVVAQHAIPVHGPKLAAQTVTQARARLSPGASPFMPKAKANGAPAGG